jgi:NhaP-type Na+/H+ or K+/H+ antiporter
MRLRHGGRLSCRLPRRTSLRFRSNRADLLVVTYAVVVFTIVVQGLTMPRLLRKLYDTE